MHGNSTWSLAHLILLHLLLHVLCGNTSMLTPVCPSAHIVFWQYKGVVCVPLKYEEKAVDRESHFLHTGCKSVVHVA
jgi:hypothetical protein